MTYNISYCIVSVEFCNINRIYRMPILTYSYSYSWW